MKRKIEDAKKNLAPFEAKDLLSHAELNERVQTIEKGGINTDKAQTEKVARQQRRRSKKK